MQAWQEGRFGTARRGRRDFDDFDELDDDELSPDEESEFAVRFMDEDEEEEGDGDGDEFGSEEELFDLGEE